MKMDVRLEGKIIEKLKDFPQQFKVETQEAINDASTHLYEQTVHATPKATSTLSRSIRRDLFPMRAEIYPTVDYAARLHGEVTRDGSLVSQRSRPFMIPAREAGPGGTLYRWAAKKGLNPWAVRAGIAKRGIKHNPWMTDTFRAEEKTIVKMLEKSIKKIAEKMRD